jgi:3'-5' exonuclease
MSYSIGKFGKNKQKQDTSYGIFGDSDCSVKQKFPIQGFENKKSLDEKPSKPQAPKPQTANKGKLGNFNRSPSTGNFVVFDIETVPCVDSARNLLNLGSEVSDSEVIERLTEYHRDITGGLNEFHRQPFHKVVCISFISGSIGYYGNSDKEKYTIKTIRSGGRNGETEEEILRKFFSYLETMANRQSLRLISFNGRSFDMPVLQYRAMKYGIDARWIFSDGLYNYNHRYSIDKHCDLLEMFSNFGASARIKMSEVCALLNIPCKSNGVDGSQVHNLFGEGKLNEIADYCETDVVATFILYLRFVHHSGKLSVDGYNIVLDNLINLLKKEEQAAVHKEFIDKFFDMNQGNIHITKDILEDETENEEQKEVETENALSKDELINSKTDEESELESENSNQEIEKEQ